MKCKSVWHIWFAKGEKKKKKKKKKKFFLSVASKSPRCRYKKKYLSLARTPRVRSLSSARVTRARLRILSSSKSRLNCEFQQVHEGIEVFSHHRRKELAREEEEKR